MLWKQIMTTGTLRQLTMIEGKMQIRFLGAGISGGSREGFSGSWTPPPNLFEEKKTLLSSEIWGNLANTSLETLFS